MLEATVVLATYNGARHLPEQLESLAAQRRPPDRLHVSDDGSSDSTWQILQTFASTAPFPVELVSRERRLARRRTSRARSGRSRATCCSSATRTTAGIPTRSTPSWRCSRALGMVLNDATMTDERLRPLGWSLFEQHRLDEQDFALMRSRRAFRVFARKMPPYGRRTALRLSVGRSALPMPEGQTYDQWIGQLAALTADVAVLRTSLQEYRQHGGR